MNLFNIANFFRCKRWRRKTTCAQVTCKILSLISSQGSLSFCFENSTLSVHETHSGTRLTKPQNP